MTKIILLDSNSLINRAYYAIPPMTTRDGVYTNAIYGYLSMLSKLISDHKPTHICAVFDLKAPTFRHNMYNQYKATRKPMAEELASQLVILRELLAQMGIKIMQKEGYEADDIIGTLGKRFDYDTIIVSGDRDVLQLVDYNTTVFNTRRGVSDIKVYTLETMAEEDFTPQKIIEYKGLAGDSSDNIPGCPGVGEKTALALLKDYGDVDGVYNNIDELKGKLKERLIENKELVYLSRTLATINTEVPIDCTLDDLAYSGAVEQEFFDHLKRLECYSLVDRFRKSILETPMRLQKPTRTTADTADAQSLEIPDDAADAQGIETLDDMEDAQGLEIPVRIQKPAAITPQEEPKELPFEPQRIKIQDKQELCRLLAQPAKTIALDFSTIIAFALDDKKEYYLEPAVDLIDEGINYDEAIECFANIMHSDTVKIIFDVKSMMRRLAIYGIEIKPPYEDILLKSYLIDTNRTPKDLKELVESSGLSAAPSAAMYRINKMLDKRINELELLNLYYKIELPLVKVLYDMEVEGFRIDKEKLNELSIKYNEELAALQKNIFAIAGEVFNINSPQQLGVILFDKLGLIPTKKTKSKASYSVAAEVLEELEHPIIEELLRYRTVAKLQSTYINGMRAVADPASGKVHTVFRQCLTATGRLSSNEPNLQNIPIRNEEGRNIRKMFVPSEGNILISADYSQIELRLLAHFSGAPDLLKAYQEGIDIHTLTASKIYDTPIELVTKEMRHNAKAVNFGIIYGISAFGLARNTGISTTKAKLFIDKYFMTYPGVLEYMLENVELAKANGYIKTIAGRIRFFPELKSPNHNIRSFGERAAMNMPLQGSASDIIKIAMLKVYDALKQGGYKAKLILQVHDELVIDAPLEELHAVKKLLVDNMQNAVPLNVPLVAEAKSGADWYSVE